MASCLKLCFSKEKKKEKRGLAKPRLMEKSLDLCSDSCSCERCLREDRISVLPQDILWLILSFLAPKEAVKASLISRRWLDLWVHTPILNLLTLDSDDYRSSYRKCRKYVQWVNSVLRRHKGHYLEELKIGYDLNNWYRIYIDRWLIFALERKVQRLELNFHYIFGHGIPNYVFPQLANLNCGIGMPQFDLKCLKSLSLNGVDVTGEAINIILQDCPFLQQLKVADTRKLVDLVISNPTSALKYLQIEYCDNLKVVSISNFKLVSLDIPAVADITLKDIPMLVELSLSDRSYMLCACVSRASSGLSQLQALTFDICYMRDVTNLSNFDKLTNLKRLVIGIVLRTDESLTKLISVMNSFPRLEECVLKSWWEAPKRSDRNICEVKRLRRSSSLESKHCLKVFEFLCYYGRLSDVEFVMHVLEEYSSSLEKIIIDPRDVRFATLPSRRLEREQENRSFALKQFEDLRESIPQHVHLHIR